MTVSENKYKNKRPSKKTFDFSWTRNYSRTIMKITLILLFSFAALTVYGNGEEDKGKIHSIIRKVLIWDRPLLEELRDPYSMKLSAGQQVCWDLEEEADEIVDLGLGRIQNFIGGLRADDYELEELLEVLDTLGSIKMRLEYWIFRKQNISGDLEQDIIVKFDLRRLLGLLELCEEALLELP